MKKFIMIITILMILALGIPTSAESDIPKGAQQFADNFFIDIVIEHLTAAHAGNFNLNPNSKNITFGPLHHVYVLTKEFAANKNTDGSGIIGSDEYISVVYQDGVPVNVIGTYENKAGVFELSAFGFGLEFTRNLDKLKLENGEHLLFEAPFDAWYIYNGKSVKPLSHSAVNLMSEEKNILDFQKIIYERYKDADDNPEMGGGISLPENTDRNENILLYSVIGILTATLIVLFIRNRRIKNK
ncbi:hypothetical protein ACFYKT_14395 [Cytobacillus sp. FJAT-53684]|uniref:Gram-positive cocci surface proteins LPxTG domain-containing protein n=1 Tax=Cytobacillus mangrovibacter TaxID=3299024 RepID=A0ABW6K046_9BACI